MKGKQSAKLIEMTDLQWEFFFTCWKYNLEFYRGGTFERYKYSIGVPLYYSMLGKKLFGTGMKYPLYRFAGFPERLYRKHLYLDFSGHRRNKSGLKPFDRDIVPAFESTRGLNMVDASQLPQAGRGGLPVVGTLQTTGD